MDDAQICVAYNAVAIALKNGYKVKVLVDAGAVNAYVKPRWKFWSKKPTFLAYRLPERMKALLAPVLGVRAQDLPKTYDGYTRWLQERGAEFYVNSYMLVVAGYARSPEDLSRFSIRNAEAVSVAEMQKLREQADVYWVY